MDIHINWEGPYTPSQAVTLNSKSDFGLYQYYGDHPTYGANVLLYIGKAETQSLGQRLSQHNWPSWIPGNTEIYIGKICSDVCLDNKEWERRISLAEKILIFSHSPAFNTANLNRIGHAGEDVRVLNWGRRRSLFPEVSISRWEGGQTLGHELPKDLLPCSCE